MPSIVGTALNVFGSREQKEGSLVPLLCSEKIAAEALTEPQGGSDFFGTTTEARRHVDHYVLRGHKRFIVGAAEVDHFLVYARSDFEAPPEYYKRLLDEGETTRDVESDAPEAEKVEEKGYELQSGS